MATYPQAGWSPQGQYQGSDQQRQAIYTGYTPYTGPTYNYSPYVNAPTQQPPAQNIQKSLPVTGGGNQTNLNPLQNQQTQQNISIPTIDYAAIDSAFNEGNNILNQQEQYVRNNEQNLYTQATSPFDVQKNNLDLSYQQGQALNNQQTEDVYQRGADALTSARRLFNELGQGVQQRFGGVNSASEFANAFLGREQQRQMGQIQTQIGQQTHDLALKAQDIKSQFQTQLTNLNLQKDSALAQARQFYQSQLDQINSNRAMFAQNKAQAKLQALMDLQNYSRNLQSAFIQQQNSLQDNFQKAALSLQTEIARYQTYAGNPVNLGQFTQATAPYLNYQSNSNVGYDPYAIVGSFDTARKRLLGLGS